MPAPRPSAGLLGLVLAGGASRRMGTDKGAISYHGRSQRAYAAELLESVCEAVYVSVRADQVADLEPDLTPLVDATADIGPMAGHLAAFAHRPDAAWLVVACDMPLLTASTLQALVAARDPSYEAVAFAGTDGRPEPMVALWEPAMGKALQKAATAGRHSLRDVLRAGRCRMLPAPEGALFDADTPSDLDVAKRLLDQ